jgi:uncharacterized protein (TIRG00374 family)
MASQPLRDAAALERRRLRRGLGRLALVGAAVAVAIVLLPGLHGVRQQLAHVAPGWLVLAAALEVLSSLSYVALFHPVFCRGMPWRVSYWIGMSEVGMSALLPAGGVGGLALGAWALRRRGMPPQRIAARSVAFFLLTSAVNVAALAVFGLGLALGVFDGPAPLGLTLLPALVALAVIPLALLIPRAARRLNRPPRHRGRVARLARKAIRAGGQGVADAVAFLRSGDPLVYLGAIGYWAFDNAVLWVCFRALGHPPSLAVIATAYLIGQLGNTLPLPAGIGGVDLGLIGTLVLFHVPAAEATAAVVSYRAIQLWVPAIIGGIALARLRSTLPRSPSPGPVAASGAEQPGDRRHEDDDEVQHRCTQVAAVARPEAITPLRSARARERAQRRVPPQVPARILDHEAGAFQRRARVQRVQPEAPLWLARGQAVQGARK